MSITASSANSVPSTAAAAGSHWEDRATAPKWSQPEPSPACARTRCLQPAPSTLPSSHVNAPNNSSSSVQAALPPESPPGFGGDDVHRLTGAGDGAPKRHPAKLRRKVLDLFASGRPEAEAQVAYDLQICAQLSYP
jgi:hypothetical protein